MASFVSREVPRCLSYGIGRPLEPVRIVRRLLGRKNLDKTLREPVEPVRHRDVAVERGGIELRQDVDAPDVRVETVADGDVDEPVLAADGHRRLRTRGRQRKETGALAAAKNNRERIG